MFNELPGTRRVAHPGRTAAMGVAAGAHGLALLLLLGASVLAVEAIDRPRLPLSFSMPLRLELPSAPPASAAPRRDSAALRSAPRTPPAVVQPPAVPTATAPAAATDSSEISANADASGPATSDGQADGKGTVAGGLPGPDSTEAVVPDLPSRPIPALSPGVTPPVVTYRLEPAYPAAAKAVHLEGLVVIEAVVNSTGQVVDARVLRGHPILARAAIDAVSQWRFTPGLLRGKPVDVILTVSVFFRLT